MHLEGQAFLNSRMEKSHDLVSTTNIKSYLISGVENDFFFWAEVAYNVAWYFITTVNSWTAFHQILSWYRYHLMACIKASLLTTCDVLQHPPGLCGTKSATVFWVDRALFSALLPNLFKYPVSTSYFLWQSACSTFHPNRYKNYDSDHLS